MYLDKDEHFRHVEKTSIIHVVLQFLNLKTVSVEDKVAF